MKRILFLLAAGLITCVGCSKKSEPPVAARAVFEPVRIAAAYTAMLEKPDATRVLLLGEDARSLTNYFANAAVDRLETAHEKADLIVIACAEMTKASCARACSLLTDDGAIVWMLDVKDITMAQFRDRLLTFDLAQVHLWMPGSENWVLVGRRTPRLVRLSAMLEVFSRDGGYVDLATGRCCGLPDLFANYVGSREDVLPAFSTGDLAAKVSPAFFLTKDIPSLDWVSDAGLDASLSRSIRADLRSMQVVRRLVVEGDLASAEAKDKAGEEAATEKWARALKRNPNDLFVLERLDRLERNAHGFLEVGKVLLAMKCYETMVLIRPEDAKAVHNFGMCLKKIGKADLAEKILKRAQTLMAAPSGK